MRFGCYACDDIGLDPTRPADEVGVLAALWPYQKMSAQVAFCGRCVERIPLTERRTTREPGDLVIAAPRFSLSTPSGFKWHWPDPEHELFAVRPDAAGTLFPAVMSKLSREKRSD